MLVVIKNSEIIAVDKEFLQTTNTSLHSLSNMINTINLQLSSLQNETITLNNLNFSVKEIELVSSENLKIFDLTLEASTAQNEQPEQETIPPLMSEQELSSPENEQIEQEIIPTLIPEQESSTAQNEQPEQETLPPLMPEEEKIEESFLPKLETESFGDIKADLLGGTTSETEEKKSEFKPTPVIQTEETIKISEEESTPSENEPKLNIDIKPEPEEAHTDQKPELKTDQSPSISIDTKQPEEINEHSLSTFEEEEIEISFEDDLEEIREILENKTSFDEAVNTELKKASDELGIDLNELEEWYKQLIEQIKDEKKTIYKNLEQKNYNNLHESYHKLKGAALNLRLSKIALILKKLDELSKDKESIEKIKQITDEFYNLIENRQPAKTTVDKETQKEKTVSEKPDKIIESIIIETIKNYLKTQNEAQFEKDKKYIEKLLNVKINSIEDLENIIKGQ